MTPPGSPIEEKRVSIPYRYDKNNTTKHGNVWGKIVSIPYRYDKNKEAIAKNPRFKRVSIPYRYDKNGKTVELSFLLVYKFQFLIGTIKTVIAYPAIPFFYLFQFLIGTIKTGE